MCSGGGRGGDDVCGGVLAQLEYWIFHPQVAIQKTSCREDILFCHVVGGVISTIRMNRYKWNKISESET